MCGKWISFKALFAAMLCLATISGCRESIDAALMEAIRNQEVGNVERLLLSGARADSLVPGETMLPLEAAAIGGNELIVDLLLKNGADPERAIGPDSPLWLALQHDHERAALAIVNAGARFDGPVRKGLTPFYCAAMLNHAELVSKMIAIGADVHAPGTQGSPMHEAADNGNLSMVQLLASSGANINRINDLGETPIFLAAEGGHWEVVQWIATHGGNVNAANKLGNTMLHEFAADDDSAGIRRLCALEVDPDLHNMIGETPLHVAAARGNAAAAIALIEDCQADLNLRDDHSLSPAGLAYREGETDMVELLTARGGRLR